MNQKKCMPCEGGLKPLDSAQIKQRLTAIPNWKLSADTKSISILYEMKNFIEAVSLIHRIAEIAERENHHPDIHLTRYRKLEIMLSTHALNGLSENDFILAAAIEALPKKLKPL